MLLRGPTRRSCCRFGVLSFQGCSVLRLPATACLTQPDPVPLQALAAEVAADLGLDLPACYCLPVPACPPPLPVPLQGLAAEVAAYLGLDLGKIKIKRFADGEAYVQIGVRQAEGGGGHVRVFICVCRGGARTSTSG